MATQLTGHDGSLTSWGDATSTVDYCYHLVNTAGSISSIKIAIMADQVNVTSGSLSAPTAHEWRNMLRAWSFSGDAFFPKAGAKAGSQGLVTFASGDVLWVNGYDMEFVWDELEITRLGQADATWKEFRPMRFVKVSGTFVGFVDSGTAMVPPVSFTGSAASATFKLTEDGSNDNEISGNIIVSALDIDVPINAGTLQGKVYKFVFSGAVTVKSTGTPGTNIFPGSTAGTALATTTWDKDGDGVADRTAVITLSTGRTWTGCAWLQRVGISVKANEPIKISYTGRGSGAFAPA